jgi:hypothetical protein
MRISEIGHVLFNVNSQRVWVDELQKEEEIGKDDFWRDHD